MLAAALQLAVIVAAGWVAALLARRWGQSTAVGHMLMGLALGPSLLGWIAPGAFEFAFGASPSEQLTWLSRAGLLLLMFMIGLAFDFSHLLHARNQRVALRVALAALLGPFMTGFAFGYWTSPILSPGIDSFAAALFVATAFSITALPILGRILIELGIERTELGAIAISSAACIDLVGWVLLGGVSALVSAGAKTTPPLGVFLVFAGFAAGVALHRSRRFADAWNARVGPAVNFVFLPLYFTFTGLRTDVGALHGAEAWAWCAAVFAVGVLGKYGITYLAARSGGLAHAQASALGAMMNTRGLVELVVLNVGLDLGVISREMFTMMVLMAVASTVMTTPMLRRWLPQALGAEYKPAVGSGSAAKA
jgi:Kef-type K+ transport system membrane component KefB